MISHLSAPYSSFSPWLQRFRIVLAFVPLGWLLLFYLFVCRAFITWSTLPLAQFPDPKNLGYALHHSLLWVGMALSLFSLIAYPTTVLLSYRKLPIKRSEVFVFVSGVVLTALVLFADPYGLLNWFLD